MKSFKDLFLFNILEEFSLMLTLGVTMNCEDLSIQKLTSSSFIYETVEQFVQGLILHVCFAGLAILITAVHLYFHF